MKAKDDGIRIVTLIRLIITTYRILEMKKILINEQSSNQVFDVSSADATISSTASSTIQTQFDQAAAEMGVLIRKRIESKKRKFGLTSFAPHVEVVKAG